MEAIVERLVTLIEENGWRQRFDEAVAQVVACEVDALRDLRRFDDFLRFLDDMVHWTPREQGDSLLVHDKLVEFHFVFDRPALRALQSRVHPAEQGAPLTPLSQWIVGFARAWGSFLDRPESARHVDTFRTDRAFRWDDYMPPPSGYLTFNQFFARHVKPGRRPIAEPRDERVVVAPADASFIGQWAIAADSTIAVQDGRVSLKRLRWSLAALLEGSAYASRFAGGVFTHSALRTFDYHRWHAPLAGTVLETRVIQGQAWLEVEVVEHPGAGRQARGIEAVEGTGYQFVQTRGLVVLDTPVGLVACMPVGMAQVSSVVITAEVGAVLRKGEELGYFQFGGSDFVMVFEAACDVRLEAGIDEHRMQGARIGTCRAGAFSGLAGPLESA